LSSKQINFYISESDIKEINNYLEINNLICIEQETQSEFLQTTIPNFNGGFYFILRQDDKNYVKFKKINEHKFYVDETFSPVIEFWVSSYNSKTMELGRGRFYYNTVFYENNKWIEKDLNFCKSAENLIKWFRKNFKNQKIENYSGFHITQSTLELIKNGVKLKN